MSVVPDADEQDQEGTQDERYMRTVFKEALSNAHSFLWNTGLDLPSAFKKAFSREPTPIEAMGLFNQSLPLAKGFAGMHFNSFAPHNIAYREIKRGRPGLERTKFMSGVVRVRGTVEEPSLTFGALQLPDTEVHLAFIESTMNPDHTGCSALYAQSQYGINTIELLHAVIGEQLERQIYAQLSQ